MDVGFRIVAGHVWHESRGLCLDDSQRDRSLWLVQREHLCFGQKADLVELIREVAHVREQQTRLDDRDERPEDRPVVDGGPNLADVVGQKHGGEHHQAEHHADVVGFSDLLEKPYADLARPCFPDAENRGGQSDEAVREEEGVAGGVEDHAELGFAFEVFHDRHEVRADAEDEADVDEEETEVDRPVLCDDLGEGLVRGRLPVFR